MFHRKVIEEVVPEETVIWSCTADDCIAWVRDNFKEKEADIPNCPMCNHEMEQATKMLPAIENPLLNEEIS